MTAGRGLSGWQRKPRRLLEHAGAAGLILAAVAFLYRSLLWPWGHPVDRLTTDFSLWFYPWLHYSVRSLLSGHIPWWSSLQGCGMPLVGGLETGVFFPGHLLLGMVTGGTVGFFAAQVYQVLNVGLSGVGAYLLLRELGVGWLAAVVGGVLWASSWDIAYHLVYINFIDVLLCLPFLLLLVHRALHRRSTLALAAAGWVLGASFLAGNAQWTAMHVYALAVLAVFWMAPALRVEPRAATLGLAAVLTLVVGGGLLMALPTLVPSWEFYALSSRFGRPAIVDPSPLSSIWRAFVADSPFGRGGLFLMLLGTAVVLRRDRTTYGLATIGTAALLLAPGGASPLYGLASRLVPGIDHFNYPRRFLHLAIFAAALLAGLGLDWLWRRAGHVPWPGLLGLGVVGVGALAVTRGPAVWTLVQGAGILAAGALARHVAWRRAILLLLVGACFALPTSARHRDDRWVTQQEPFYHAEPLVAWFQAHPGLYRITNAGALITHAQARDYWNYHRWLFGGAYVTGIASWAAAGSLHLRDLDLFAAQTSYGRLYDLMNIRYLPQGLDPPPAREGKYEAWDLKPGSRWQLDLAGLAPLAGVVELGLRGPGLTVDVERGGGAARVVGAAELVRVSGLPEGRFLTIRVRDGRGRATSIRVGGVEILGAAPRWRPARPGLWENVHVLPRAFVVNDYEVHPDRDALRGALVGLEPTMTVLLEETPQFSAPGRPGSFAGVHIVRYEPHEVVITARLVQPGILVLTDTYYPGWRAEVNGASVRMYRANYLFRGVALGPGEHRVVFRYAPRWRPWVWIASAIGILGTIVLSPPICRRLPDLPGAASGPGGARWGTG